MNNHTVIEKLTALVQQESKPYSSKLHFISTAANHSKVFIPNRSQFVSVSEEVEQKLKQLVDTESSEIDEVLATLGIDVLPAITDTPLETPPTHALSLAISQKCNMGCMYCYAEQGSFGGPSKSMPLETALASIDMLIDTKKAGERVQLTFLGGEPLVNRGDIVKATEYAYKKAQERQVKIGFSITTNGTLLQEQDMYFFEKYGFAVTISIDGDKNAHDALRPMKGGKGSYDTIIQNVSPFLTHQKNMQVSARVTITPSNLNLRSTLNELIALGFHSVGFSPLLNSSNHQGEMQAEDLQLLLKEMIACGLDFEENLIKGKRFPFLNMVNAFKEIAKQTHRPYPCGAGAGYMGVSADGELAACHRFVNEDRGALGTIAEGIDTIKQNNWLAERHVHQQTPCTQCWARYLCGGGCHHEVLDKGRPACDYIRGWLYYTLQAYDRINRLVPNWMN